MFKKIENNLSYDLIKFNFLFPKDCFLSHIAKSKIYLKLIMF